MSTTGPKIRKGRGSLVPELPANHPVYTRGFAIGVVRSTSPKPTAEEPYIPSADECAPAAGDFPNYPAPSCPDCDGFVVLMERQGDTVHYRCRSCGIGFSREEPEPAEDSIPPRHP
jgi:hypothetical protein